MSFPSWSFLPGPVPFRPNSKPSLQCSWESRPPMSRVFLGPGLCLLRRTQQVSSCCWTRCQQQDTLTPGERRTGWAQGCFQLLSWHILSELSRQDSLCLCIWHGHGEVCRHGGTCSLSWSALIMFGSSFLQTGISWGCSGICSHPLRGCLSAAALCSPVLW